MDAMNAEDLYVLQPLQVPVPEPSKSEEKSTWRFDRQQGASFIFRADFDSSNLSHVQQSTPNPNVRCMP